MSYYTGFQNLAARMIRDKGVSVTIRRTIPATFNPATGLMGSPVVVVATAGDSGTAATLVFQYDLTVLAVGDCIEVTLPASATTHTAVDSAEFCLPGAYDATVLLAFLNNNLNWTGNLSGVFSVVSKQLVFTYTDFGLRSDLADAKFEYVIAPIDYIVSAIFSAVDIERVDGTNVLFTDLVAKIPAEGLSILPAAATDVIIRGSDTYGIKEVSVIQPADLALLYEVRCGK